MVKDDFRDLLDVGDRENGSGDEEGTLATVIKNSDLAEDDSQALVGEKKVVEGESFVLKLYEKDGVIDSIDIECKCGRTTKIQLEYTKSSVGGDSLDLELGEKSDAPRAGPAPSPELSSTPEAFQTTGADQEDEDSEEFQEGVTAQVLTTPPDVDAVKQPDETGDASDPHNAQ